MNSELLNLSIRLGYICEWSDEEIIFPEYGVVVNNKNIYEITQAINYSSLENIVRIANKWLELQKLGVFKI